MNIQEALRVASQKLISHSHSPLLDAEILLSFCLKKNQIYLLTHYEEKITSTQQKKYFNLIKKRINNFPVAYLTNEKWFFGKKFFVNKNVLVPRPETEIMVEKIIEKISNSSCKNIILIDLGTGSGCIPISVNKNLLSKKIQTLAIDISASALLVAKKNIKLHKLSKKIQLLKGNLLTPLIRENKYKKQINRSESLIIISANLPYLTPEQVKKSKSIQKEPRQALVAGTDGLKYYRLLFEQISQHFNNKNVITFCEIDPSQKNKIKQLIKNKLPNSQISLEKDYKSHHRLVIIS